MRRVMIKGLLAHKLRLALTALSVVLGVGFVAGTFVLTDTLAHAFDSLFSEVNGKTDGQIRSTQKLSPQDPAEPDRDGVEGPHGGVAFPVDLAHLDGPGGVRVRT